MLEKMETYGCRFCIRMHEGMKMKHSGDLFLRLQIGVLDILPILSSLFSHFLSVASWLRKDLKSIQMGLAAKKDFFFFFFKGLL